jgi:hypothetical protein
VKLHQLRARFKPPVEASVPELPKREKEASSTVEDVRATYVGVDWGLDTGESVCVAAVRCRGVDGSTKEWRVLQLPSVARGKVLNLRGERRDEEGEIW